MKKRNFLLTFLVANFFAGSTTFAQNLLQNGKFEQAATGWEAISSQANPIIEHSKSYQDYGLADNFVGTNFVELDAVSAIQQTITTKKDEKYTLVFSYSHRPNAGDKELIVLVNGKPVYTEKIANTPDAGSFRYKHTVFTANGEKATIGFYVVSLNGDESKGVLLTNVLAGIENETDLNLYYSY